MATAPRFDEGLYDSQPPQQKQSSGWRTCLIGCLVVCAVIGLLLVVLAIWVARNFRTWAADLGTEVVSQMVEGSDLPPQEKIEIKAQIDRVAAAYRDGAMSNDQLGELFERLVESPLMPSLMVAAADKQYLDKSRLSEEEKAAGRITLQRFVRGAIDEKIPEPAINSVIDHIGTHDPDGDFELKQNVTDDELRAFLAAAKDEADKAGIPDQPQEIDPSDEIKKIVDETLGEEAPPPMTAEPAPTQ